MSTPDHEPPEPQPSGRTLRRVASLMALARDLAATPGVGGRRVRRMLGGLRDLHGATAAAARVDVDGDAAAPTDLARVGWTRSAELARGRSRLGVLGDDFLVDRVALRDGRQARVELYRADASAFGPAEAAWLATAHAACVWIYDDGSAPRRPIARTLEHLSPRDRETLEHLLDGASEKQIAARIGRSPHTVHTRVKRIYRRFDVTSRPELLSRFLSDDAMEIS